MKTYFFSRNFKQPFEPKIKKKSFRVPKAVLLSFFCLHKWNDSRRSFLNRKRRVIFSYLLFPRFCHVSESVYSGYFEDSIFDIRGSGNK